MIPGIGTAVNVVTVLVGATVGVLLGNRLPVRTRDVVTDSLGLVTLLIAGTSAVAVLDSDLSDAVGSSAPMLVVLGSLLLGGILGSLLRLEQRVEWFGGWLQTRLAGAAGAVERHRFIEGFVTASLLFCTGPLTILGSLNDGLGNGADQLFLKAVLDGFVGRGQAARVDDLFAVVSDRDHPAIAAGMDRQQVRVNPCPCSAAGSELPHGIRQSIAQIHADV